VSSAEVSTAMASARPVTTLLTGKTPASVIAGQTKVFTQTITFVNSGKLTLVETLTTRWFLSATTTISDSAIALPGVTKKSARLKPNTRLVSSCRIAGITASIPAGTYYLIAQTTDGAGAVSTTIAGRTISVAAPTVSLQAAFSATPRSVSAGNALGLTLRLTNSGNVAANGSLPITLTVVDTSGNILQTLSFKRAIHVAAGKNLLLRLSVKLGSTLPSEIAVNALLTPAGSIAFSTGGAISASTATISVLTRSAAR
jgi:hypothetical protein